VCKVLVLQDQGISVEDIKKYISEKMPDLKLEVVDSRPLLEETFSEGGIKAIVMDVDVGWIDYKGVIEQARKHFVYLPVIVYSDCRDVSVITSVIKSGCYDYILNGERGLQELADCLGNIVENKELWKTIPVKGFIFETFLSLFPIGILYEDPGGELRFLDGRLLRDVSVQPEEYIGKPVKELERVAPFKGVLKSKGEAVGAVDYNESRIGFMLREEEKGRGKFYMLLDHSHVSSQRNALKEQEMLLRELNHRIKNNLQFVMSLLNIYKRNVKVPGVVEVLQDIQNRVYPMLVVHEKLYRDGANRDLRMDLLIQVIVSMISRTYSPAVSGVDCKVDVESVVLDADKAISIGMIVNELVTNAYKHAFPDDFRGEKKIRVSMRYDKRGRGFRLEVSNSGVELKDVNSLFDTQQLGMRLVQMFVKDKLEGKLKVISGRGLKFVITFK